jgi:hypothetical protein
LYEPKPSSKSVSRMKKDQEWVKDELNNGVLTAPNEEDFMANWHSENDSYSSGDYYHAFIIEVK